MEPPTLGVRLLDGVYDDWRFADFARDHGALFGARSPAAAA